MAKILSTLGEPLSEDEMAAFFELAKNDADPNLINIQTITEILLPKI